MFNDQSSQAHSSSAALRVLIAGAGVAALETALALEHLGGDRVAVTLVSPATEFVYRPMAVLEPFVGHPPRSLELSRFAAEIGATLELGTVIAVDAGRRAVWTDAGRELSYDALVIATGARPLTPPDGMQAIDVSRLGASLKDLIKEIDAGSVHHLAFVIPKPTWPLPAYEIALLAGERARVKGVELEVVIATAEARPLAVFGDEVSDATSTALDQAGITVITGTTATWSDGVLIVDGGQRRLPCDRVVAMPQLAGPKIAGLPADAAGFLPVTPHGRIIGLDGAYAAGDATDFPVKFGAIATHQADAVAASIAAEAGAPVVPAAFEGIVHGILLMGAKQARLYFSARIEDGSARESQTSTTPTAVIEAKVAARYLGPYLDKLWASGPRWLAEQLAWESTLTRLEQQFAA